MTLMKSGIFAGLLAATISLTAVSTATAQEDVRDPKAKTVLEQLKAKNQGMKSVKIGFKYNMFHAEGIDETREGTLLMQGDLYKVDMAGQTIISDGKFMYTIIDDVELQINNLPDPSEQSQNWMNPKSMLNIDEKDFKYRHDGTGTDNGKAVDIIKLFPVDAGSATFHTVTLKVDKAKMQPTSIVIQSKDGNRYTLTIKSLTENPSIPADTFKVNPNASKWEDVIDLRD